MTGATMAIKPKDLDPRDRELCQRYLEGMRRQGLEAHEPWELELETWAQQPGRLLRASTIRKLRLRFADQA
jgi:hypothetical protein